jgi:hypothetical protein
MHIHDLLRETGTLDNEIIEGDCFELDIDGFILETVVVGTKADGPILAIDDVALAYIPTETLSEAEYQGRNVPLGKPMQGDVKKSKVYVRKPNGNIVKVNFGDKKLSIKKHIPGRRKSFRARHHCENPGPRWKARYWSCRAW